MVHAPGVGAAELRQALEQGKVADACPKFEESLRLDDAIGATARLHEQGIGAILTHLGENLETVEAAGTDCNTPTERTAINPVVSEPSTKYFRPASADRSSVRRKAAKT